MKQWPIFLNSTIDKKCYLTFTFPSRVFKLYMEHKLSRPPQATKLPDGAYAQVITQLDRNGIA